VEGDCAICPFQPVCGPAVPGRAAAAAASASGPVRDFLRLKGAEG
jgi:hypothetical protein